MASASLMEDARPSLSDPPAIPPSQGGINMGRVSVASERGERGSMCSCISVVSGSGVDRYTIPHQQIKSGEVGLTIKGKYDLRATSERAITDTHLPNL